MLNRNGWRIGSLGGVEIRIDPSWSIIALLVGYTIFLILNGQFEAQSNAVLVPIAIGMAVVFFLSVLLHELAHSWVALARGIPVEGITLFLFGGATHADPGSKGPTDEFVIAVVGPITSLLLGGVFWLAHLGLGNNPIGFAVGYLGWINVLLGVFNLVPGFPLDGGRILRSLAWKKTGNLMRATRIAGMGGRIVGMILIGLGLFELIYLGALLGGLWLMAIGWFLNQAAAVSYATLRLETMLKDIPSERVMTSDLHDIPAGTDLRTAVDEHFRKHNVKAFTVTSGDTTLGSIELDSIKEMGEQEWDERTVDDVLEPLSELRTIDVSDDLGDIAGELVQGQVERVFAIEDGRIAGIITKASIIQWLERSEGLEDVEQKLSLP